MMTVAAAVLVVSWALLPHCTGDVSTIPCERGASVMVLGRDHQYNTSDFLAIYHNRTLLANCHGGPMVLGPDSERREMFCNGSLLIQNLTYTDSGEYTLCVNFVPRQTQWILVNDPDYQQAEDHPIQDTGGKPRGYRILLAPVVFIVVVISVLLLVGACHGYFKTVGVLPVGSCLCVFVRGQRTFRN